MDRVLPICAARLDFPCDRGSRARKIEMELRQPDRESYSELSFPSSLLRMNPLNQSPIQVAVSESVKTVESRLFESGDLRALYAIEEACFEPAVRFSRALMRSLAYDPSARTWLGIVENVRVGFAIVGLQAHDQSAPPNTAYIWTIEVLPAFRRLGVARALLACAETSAREAECDALELHVSERNAGALAMYEAANFARVGIEAQYYGRGEDAFRYRKLLS